jgi:hypothetical protein
MITSAEEFVTLRTSTDSADYTRAQYESAPMDVWQEVIAHYPEMRFWVAHNKTVPADILAVLADDADPRVRYLVAAKRKAPAEVLTKLATDPDDSVRMAVAQNASTSHSVLKILIRDSWQPVVEEATRRLTEGQVATPR